LCDGVDNNCNGDVDEGYHVGEACDGPDRDSCARGMIQCDPANSLLTQCVGDAPETLEVCNGRDDNCDGRIDENWDFNNDVANCGGCNIVCSNPHGTATSSSAPGSARPS
jgi:hypothetical protein